MGCKTCCVYGCDNKMTDSKMFAFPKDLERRQKWINFCKNPMLSESLTGRYFLCWKHFDPKYFVGSANKVCMLRAPVAVPTLNPPKINGLTGGVNDDASNEENSKICSDQISSQINEKNEKTPIEKEQFYQYWVIISENKKPDRVIEPNVDE